MQLYSLGGLLVGMLVGTILAVWAAKRKQKDLAFIGFCCCVFFGSIGGLILIIPIVAIFLWLIWKANNKSKQVSVDEPNKTEDDKFYDEVARELQEKPMVPGLWTKAFAEMGGDDAKARALYIKYRVAQLAEASRQKRTAIGAADAKIYAAIEAAERQNRTRLHRNIHWVFGVFCGLLCLFSGLCGIICIIGLFTDKDFNSDDLAPEIAGGIFCLIIAFMSGLGVRKCQREI